MDPFSLTAGALQIAGACAQCTVTIIKICGDIKSVDARISSFCDEVRALRGTYEGLEKSLSSPLLLEAARVASQTSDGAHLWTQIKDALDDSKKTMRRVNDILILITKASGFARRVKAHLIENLHHGELSRLRQRIQFFNAALSLPIQMVCVMLQLEQRGMTAENHNSLDIKLVSLERNMRDLVQSLNAPSRSQTLGGATIVGTENMKADDDHLKSYVTFAKKFLTTASAAASTRSSMSTISQALEPDVLTERQPSFTDLSRQTDNRTHVEGWIQVPPAGILPPYSPGRVQPTHRLSEVRPAEDNEVEFMRTKQHLKLGQDAYEQSEHSKAERHFRRALALMQDHDFDGRISLQPPEVVLLLAESCLNQDKHDEAVILLEPVAAMRADIFPGSSTDDEPSTGRRCSTAQGPDKLQALAASHLLGRVFVVMGDYDKAEKQALRAFMERRKELGQRDEKTIESVRLVIEIYKTRGEEGDEEEAEGYEVFLSPPQNQTPSLSTDKLLPINSEIPRLVPALIAPDPIRPDEFTNIPRTSFVRRFRHLGRSSQTTLAQNPPSPDQQRLSFSRSTTINDPQDSDIANLLGIRGMSSPSEASTHERALSMSGDDESITTPSTGRLSRSSSSRTLEPTFQAIADLCKERKFDRAVKVAIGHLDTYPSSVMLIRRPELKENIRHGYGLGLARTGKGYAPLHFFCELKEEHAEEVNLLIRQGVDVNAVAFKAGYNQANPKGAFTALQQAAERGFSTITSLLLSVKDIKTDVRDSELFTPLMVACRKGHHNIVKQLLEFSTPNEFPSTWHGNTLLHDASRRCDPILVDILLERVNSIDIRDRFGKTALMHAVIKADIPDPIEKQRRIKGRCKTVQILLEAGADPTLRDHRTSKTVREYAVEEDDAELMMLLDQAPRIGISELGA